jgi:hypothetical protein
MWNKIGGSFMALMGVVGLCVSLYWLYEEVLLDVTGYSTAGVVTEKSTSDDEDHNTSYYISYSYEDSNGQSHTSRSDVFKSMYDSHTEGATIPVVYSTTFPSISRIRSTGEYLLGGCVLAAISGVPLWLGLRVLLQQIHWDNKLDRLIKNGERRIGRLVALEDDKAGEVEDYMPRVLVYAFTDKTGQEHTGKTFHVKPRDHDFWRARIGCPLDVRVNPADPTDHIALIEESKLLK